MRQRGRRNVDVDLILRCGTPIGEDVYFLSGKDVAREIERRKHEIQYLERNRNRKLVVADDTVVTCYRSKESDQKRTLRNGRERS
jgi:hypothetical protein